MSGQRKYGHYKLQRLITIPLFVLSILALNKLFQYSHFFAFLVTQNSQPLAKICSWQLNFLQISLSTLFLSYDY